MQAVALLCLAASRASACVRVEDVASIADQQTYSVGSLHATRLAPTYFNRWHTARGRTRAACQAPTHSMSHSDFARPGTNINTVEGVKAGGRAARLTREREADQKAFEDKKAQIEADASKGLGRIDDKFDKTILNTVLSGGGLQTAAQYKAAQSQPAAPAAAPAPARRCRPAASPTPAPPSARRRGSSRSSRSATRSRTRRRKPRRPRSGRRR